MPPYITDPNTPRRGYLEGTPAYHAGSYAIGQQAVRMFVTSVAIAANVVTLGVKIVEGNIPVLGSLVSFLATVRGITQAPNAVNVTNVALASCSINAATGVGTITYPATAANQATTPDGGQVLIPVPEVAELLAVAKLQQFAVPYSNPELVSGRAVTWSWSCPSAPATIALQLEGAINDVDTEYAIIGVSQTTTSGTIIGNVPLGVRFLRVNVTAFTGGASPSIIAKSLI